MQINGLYLVLESIQSVFGIKLLDFENKQFFADIKFLQVLNEFCRY